MSKRNERKGLLISLTPDEYEAVREAADERDISLTYVLRILIRNALMESTFEFKTKEAVNV